MHPMANVTSPAVINCLRCTFSVDGIQDFIISENGPSLVSQEFNTFCKLNAILHSMITSHHPSPNGAD